MAAYVYHHHLAVTQRHRLHTPVGIQVRMICQYMSMESLLYKNAGEVKPDGILRIQTQFTTQLTAVISWAYLYQGRHAQACLAVV